MESKSKGEAAHLDASAKIGRGRGGDDGSDDGAALRADGGWRSAAASAPGLARPRGTAGPPPGAPSGWTAAWDARAGRGASCTRGARRGRRGAAQGRGRRRRARGAAAAAGPDAGRHRDTAWRVLRGDAARARRLDDDSGSDGARAVPVPAPDGACPARTPRRRAAEGAGAAAPNKGTTPTRTAARGARDIVHEESWPVRGHGVAGAHYTPVDQKRH